MNRKTRSILLFAIILGFVAWNLVPLSVAQEDDILLGAEGGMPGQRAAPDFSHDLHMAVLDCLACHHAYEDGLNVLDEDELVEGNPAIRCGACHNDQADLKRQEAYHRQCIGCHIDTRKAGQASGPEMCGACHRPES
jgi:hypothetical protein